VTKAVDFVWKWNMYVVISFEEYRIYFFIRLTARLAAKLLCEKP